MAVTAAHTMRKFLNDPGQVTSDFLDGLASAHPDVVRYDREQRIVVRRNAPVEGKVGLVSAGGTGVEPLHGGFVGLGMLDAACPGEIFTSPNPDQIMAATRVADAGAGVLHVIKNFPGEVMNFKLVEMDAEDEGLTTEAVLIDDDVAVPKTHPAGRRGIGATVLVEKLAGAAAERGDDLQAVATVARRVNARARSFGIALSSCTPPGAGRRDLRAAAGRDRGRDRHQRRAELPPRADAHCARARDRRWSTRCSTTCGRPKARRCCPC